MILKLPGCLAGEPRGGASVSSAAYDNIEKKTKSDWQTYDDGAEKRQTAMAADDADDTGL